jgi:hypothetical protein
MELRPSPTAPHRTVGGGGDAWSPNKGMVGAMGERIGDRGGALDEDPMAQINRLKKPNFRCR